MYIKSQQQRALPANPQQNYLGFYTMSLAWAKFERSHRPMWFEFLIYKKVTCTFKCEREWDFGFFVGRFMLLFETQTTRRLKLSKLTSPHSRKKHKCSTKEHPPGPIARQNSRNKYSTYPNLYLDLYTTVQFCWLNKHQKNWKKKKSRASKEDFPISHATGSA